MAVFYSKLEIPEKFSVETESSNFDHGHRRVYRIGPLERGFGHSIGNTLRRTLLTSIEGMAPIAIGINVFDHEFMACDDIKEDMVQICLNAKEILINPVQVEDQRKLLGVKQHHVQIAPADLNFVNGEAKVTFGDAFKGVSGIEILNPDEVLFTVTNVHYKKTLDIKIYYAKGRGWVSSAAQQEVHPDLKLSVNDIPLDSTHTPVRMVTYDVKQARVGDKTDYDMLVLDIETDGREMPDRALSFAGKILMRYLGLVADLQMEELEFEAEEEEIQSDKDHLKTLLKKPIVDLELSVRAANCLNLAGIKTIGELVKHTEADMMRYRNFGKKSLVEIIEQLTLMGLHFGMKVEDDEDYGDEEIEDDVDDLLDSDDIDEDIDVLDDEEL